MEYFRVISIHALREEGDSRATSRAPQSRNFYPRPPRGGRPAGCSGGEKETASISIHALREEGDGGGTSWDCLISYFYPRPPRGGRRHLRPEGLRAARISIHALREEGDRFWILCSSSQKQFLSTPSARRATAKTETKSLFSYKLYNILHEFRRALIYNGSKNDPNHAKRHKNPVRRCRKNAENSPFAPGRETQNNSRPSCSKGG